MVILNLCSFNSYESQSHKSNLDLGCQIKMPESKFRVPTWVQRPSNSNPNGKAWSWTLAMQWANKWRSGRTWFRCLMPHLLCPHSQLGSILCFVLAHFFHTHQSHIFLQLNTLNNVHIYIINSINRFSSFYKNSLISVAGRMGHQILEIPPTLA